MQNRGGSLQTPYHNTFIADLFRKTSKNIARSAPAAFFGHFNLNQRPVLADLTQKAYHPSREYGDEKPET
jgi:hypothetical protein